jgi:hypothetical protein
MTKDTTCRTYLLPDNPSEVDEFSESHSKVAEAIVQLMHEDKGGISIGLEGEWGTGKSTVMKLLSNILEREKNGIDYLFFTFDAWAHEGDPLRKSFLEQLISLFKSKWIPEEEWKQKNTDDISWEDKWKQLIGTKTKTEVTNSPEITTLGLYVIVAGFFVPIGLAIVNECLRNGGTYNLFSRLHFSWYLFVGTVLTLLPLFIYFGGYACARIKGKKQKIINWGVIIQKFDTITISQTTKSPDPTSVEFEKFFSELINYCLDNKKRRLVLVLDNLDRISPSDALSILSTMQTFLQCKSNMKPEALNHLWVIIPYDREGLEKLWEKANDVKEKEVASSMIDKRFQVRFRVPPMVLSNWEKYFEKQLSEAFPDHKNIKPDEFSSSLLVYYIHQNLLLMNKVPTPRGIKIFINQIGTIHRVWNDEFPLQQMAYFVSLINRKEDFPKQFIAGKIPEEQFKDVLGDKVPENMAAMWFNIEPNIAIQILLEKPILESILNRDVNVSKDLEDKHKEWFWSVFNKNLTKSELVKTPNFLLSIAFCISKNKLMHNSGDASSKTIHSIIEKNVLNVTSWKPLDDKTYEGFKALFDIIPEAEFVESILMTIASNDFIGDKKFNAQHDLDAVTLEGLENEMTTEIDTFIKLVKFVKSSDLISFSGKRKIKISTDCHRSIEVYSRLFTTDPEGDLWKIITTTASDNENSIALLNLINQNELSSRHIGVFYILIDTDSDIKWVEINTAIAVVLHQSSVKNTSALLQAMWVLYAEKKTNLDKYIELNNSGFLHHQFVAKKDENDFESCAWSIFSIFLSPLENQQPNFGRSGEGFTLLNQFLANPVVSSNKEIFENLVEIVVNECQVNYFINLSERYPQIKPLIIALLNDLLNWEEISELFPPDELIRNWKAILSYMEKLSFSKLIEKLCQEDYPLEKTFDSFSPDDAGLFSEFYNSITELKTKNEYSNQLINNLRIIEKERWLLSLTEEDTLLELLLFLIGDDKKVGLKIDFLNAYTDYCKKVLVSGISPKRFINEWKTLPNSITDQRIRRNLISTVINHAKANDVETIFPIFFDLYGDLISNPTVLMKNTDTVSRMFTPLVQNSNERGLVWLAELFENNPDAFDKREYGDEMEVFKLQVSNKLKQENPDSIKGLLLRIAKVLKIDYQEPQNS